MRYLEPTTVDEALDALAEHGESAKVIAGGQSLLIMMRDRLVDPELLIGLNALAINIMLPALGDIGAAFDIANPNDRQLVVVVYLFSAGVAQLAYGEKRRLEIGLALACSPSLLLLDEPLAGMSPRERVETVELLRSIGRGRTMVVIDHDIDSLFELVERVTVMQEGKVLVEGAPDEIKRNAAVQEAYLGGVNGVH